MTPEILITLAVLVFIFAALTFSLAAMDVVLCGGLAVLILTGVVDAEKALRGLSNPGVVTIGLLFIISTAAQNTGNLDGLITRILGTSRRGGYSALMFRMMIPVSALSAFINNTPIVVMLTPVIKRWAERLRLSASKFLIPLSYATVLGGTCTLLGTSTNLLVQGLLLDNGFQGLKLFELAWIGIPCTVVGLVYLSVFGKNLLPDRQDVRSCVEKNPKEYVIEMRVQEGSPIEGKSIKEAGLRNLKGLYLLDIEREGQSLVPVSSTEILKGKDRLLFVGVPSAVLDLQEMPGLIPAAHKMFEEDFTRMRTHLVEAVVSSGSPILGKSVKEADFRKRYGAGVVAVHRNGERIKEKVGSIRLNAGDTLLLFADEKFMESWKDSSDFYLISYLKDRPPTLPYQSAVTLGIITLMILASAFGEYLPQFGLPKITILHSVLGAALLLLATKCVELQDARKAIKWNLLLMIASAIGISHAIEASGTANMIAGFIAQGSSGFGTVGTLAVIYLVTLLFTELLTNNAAVALIFPIAVRTASQLGVDPMPFVIAITIAASCGFATPMGYQTHMIVQGPGGYKFSDYLKVGIPLDFLMAAIAIGLIPFIWPF